MEGVITLGVRNLSRKIKEKEQFEDFGETQILTSVKDSITSGMNTLKTDNLYTKLADSSSASTGTVTSFDRISSIMFIIFWVFLGVYCAYLSWSCNELIGWNNVYKSIYSLGAFLFPFYYIIMYYVGKFDMILYIKKHTRKNIKTK